MDNEMIERCLIAARDSFNSNDVDCKPIVLAVIKAMREPTEKMKNSIEDEEVNCEYNISWEIEKGYIKMIDAILND